MTNYSKVYLTMQQMCIENSYKNSRRHNNKINIIMK